MNEPELDLAYKRMFIAISFALCAKMWSLIGEGHVVDTTSGLTDEHGNEQDDITQFNKIKFISSSIEIKYKGMLIDTSF